MLYEVIEEIAYGAIFIGFVSEFRATCAYQLYDCFDMKHVCTNSYNLCPEGWGTILLVLRMPIRILPQIGGPARGNRKPGAGGIGLGVAPSPAL